MNDPAPTPRMITLRALALGDRIDVAGLERADTISTSPLAFHAGRGGFVALYRFGVAVLCGLSPLEEEEIVGKLGDRVSGARAGVEDEESAKVEIVAGSYDKVPPGGPIVAPDLSEERFLVIADALAKSVALARDERRVKAVFAAIEPFAAELALRGRPPLKRRTMLELIGQALLLQHSLSGRVEVLEKPDILWDRPDLERLYARLNDEYEVNERAKSLKNKLEVIVETARLMTDIIEANRATRLEATVVFLIFAEIVISLVQIALYRSLH